MGHGGVVVVRTAREAWVRHPGGGSIRLDLYIDMDIID